MRRARVWIPFAILGATIALAGRGLAQAPAEKAVAPANAPVAAAATGEHNFAFFSFWTDKNYGGFERWGLVVVLGVAIAGLIYALALVGQVIGADRGTQKIVRALMTGYFLHTLAGDKAYRDFSDPEVALPKAATLDPFSDDPVDLENKVVALLKP